MGAEGSFDRRAEGPLRLQEPRYFRGKGTRRPLTPQDVYRVVLGSCHQPRGWIVRHVVLFFFLFRATERVLLDIFRQLEIVEAKYASQGGNDAPRLAAEQMLYRVAHIFMMGRISTAPPRSRIGHPFDSSAAWARSFASFWLFLLFWFFSALGSFVSFLSVLR